MCSIMDKVALITGGASGIRLEYVKELLKNGLKGVLMVDINPEFGKTAIAQLSELFGNDKIAFFQADIMDQKSFRSAFKTAVSKFNQLDIVINNAGILNDKLWERQVDINIKGLITGSLLALEFLPQYKSGDEAHLINISSVLGFDPVESMPIYSASKSFGITFSRAIGSPRHYQETNVKVINICPGSTNTPLIRECRRKTLGQRFENILEEEGHSFFIQTPTNVAKGLVEVLQKAETGSVWVIEDEKPPVQVQTIPRQQLYKF